MVVNEKSKRNKIVIIAFLITAILATTITSVLAFGETKEGYRTITVIEIQGTVGVVRNNMEYAAYTGMHLEEGYTIVTGGNSYIRLLLDDDKYVKLEAGTKAIFSAVSGGKTAIDIERGALVAEVTKPLQVDEDFVINTPNAVLAVRGTLFRVDLSRNDKGELNTDVMTYGGAVSSKRVQPNGDVDNVEVTVKEGFKATVNMDDKETVYLVDEVKVDLSALVGSPSGDNKPDDTTTLTNANGETVTQPALTLESVLMPIVVEDIPNDDLVDIYFAAENGHSMFIETKEIKTKIEERNIDISEKTPVYEVAKNVIKPVEIVIPDDNKPLLITTEVKTEQVVAVQGTPNDGVGDETTTEVTTETITELVTTEPTTVVIITVPTTTVPTTTVPTTTVPTTTVPTTTVPTTIVPTTESTTVTTTEQTTEPTTEPTTEITTEPTTEEITVHIHTEITEEIKATCTENGLKTVKCSTCGEIISETVLTATGHTEKTNTVDATCTESGKKTVTCSICGELISESVLQATGHTEILSGTKDAHTECSVCYEILSDKHNYQTSRTEPSCTLDGGTTYVCECGYNYTETIPSTGHDEVYAGQASVHTKCNICNEVLSDDHTNYYTKEVIKESSCLTKESGELRYICSCGWSYTTEISPTHEKSDVGLTCKGCGGVWVDLNSTNFPDSMFLSYLSANYDADGNNALIGSEVTGVVTIDVSGNSTTDGGYTNLTGIKNFTNLTAVNCAYNSRITSLDLSGLTSLTNLDVTGLTGLETLNISGCTNLTDEKIIGLDTCTTLKTLNASGCVNLAELNLNSNTKVESVDLNGCTALTSFVMGDDTVGNYLLNSIDLTGCNNLETLEINSAMYLTSFDFSDKIKIKSVDLGGCQGITSVTGLSGKTTLISLRLGALNKITELDASGCSALKDLSISACSKLETLNLTDTAITKFNMVDTTVMDLSSYTKLQKAYFNGLTTTTSFVLTDNTSLKEFYLTGNVNVQALDFSANTALEKLTLSSTSALTSLDISKCANLNTLNLLDTGLTSLTLTAYNASALTSVQITNNNSLTDISISGAGALTSIKLSDGSDNYRVKNLSIIDSAIETLDVSFLKNIETLNVSGCASLASLIAKDCTQLSTLTLTGCSGLTDIDVSNSAVSSLDVTACMSLKILDASGTTISSLDVSKCTMLTDLNVSGCTYITEIDVSACTVLVNLNVSGTAITALEANQSLYMETIDVSDCMSLGGLVMDQTSNNNLISVDVSGCKSMMYLQISNSNSLQELNLAGLNSLSAAYIDNCTAITSIDISNTRMSDIDSLNISSLTNFKTLKASDADLSDSELVGMLKDTLEVIDVSGNNSVTTIDLSGFVNLKTLDVSNSGLTKLEVSDCLNLETVNVSNCSQLDYFVMSTGSAVEYSNLSSVNISGCTSMTLFQLSDASNLETLELSGLSSLEDVYVQNCPKITSLDLSSATNILRINVAGSGLTSGSIALPDGKNESIITGLS